MQKAIKNFIKRAPRYKISSEDDCLCKFSKENEKDSLTAEFVNISATGLAFITDRDFAPQFGDLIKLQFTIPHSDKKLNWWGRVVRLQEHSTKQWWQTPDPKEDLVQVAVHFQDFPEHQKEHIGEAIRKQFIEIAKRKRQKRFETLFNFFYAHKWKIIGIGTFTIFAFLFLYYVSRPSENYDPQRGSPWGKRFKSMTWEKSK